MKLAFVLGCIVVLIASCATVMSPEASHSDYDAMTYPLPDEAEEIAKAIVRLAAEAPNENPAETIAVYNRMCDFIAPQPAARVMRIGSILFEGESALFRSIARPTLDLELEFLALCALTARHGFGLDDRVYLHPHDLNVEWKSDKLVGPFVIVGDVPIRVGYGGGISGIWPSWRDLVEGVFPDAETEPRYLLPDVSATEVAELAMAIIDEAERETGRQWRHERQMVRIQCIFMLDGVEFTYWMLSYTTRDDKRWRGLQDFVSAMNFKWNHARERFCVP